MVKLLSEEDPRHMDGRKVFVVPVVDGEATFSSEFFGLGWGTVDIGNNRIRNDARLGYWAIPPVKETLRYGYYYLAFDCEVTPEEATLANKDFRFVRGLDR